MRVGGAYAQGAFDIVLSRAVLEHVYDIDTAMQTMDFLLKPGGYMIHDIDFRDHGIFTTYGFSPLEFLTVSDWARMRASSGTGAPNGRLADYYRKTFEVLGYDARILFLHVFGNDQKSHKERIESGVDYGNDQLRLISRIRPRLLPGFRQLPVEDQLVSGAFICARKSP